MADTEATYRRWAELMDRQAVGEALSPEELSFCERMANEHPAAMRELEWLDELADLDAAPDAGSRALVDATLARLADETKSAEHDELSRLKRTRVPKVVWMGAAGAAAAVAIAALLLPHRKPAEPSARASQPAPRVELVYASGDVRVDGATLEGHSTMLSEGSTIAIGRGAACLAMDPEINVCLAEGSTLTLSRTHSPWRRLDLAEGKVAVQLAPQPEGYHLSVVADGVWSTAVGTAFTVQRAGGQAVQTAVLNGKVRVGHDDGQEQLVAAHERAEVRGGETKLSAVSRNDESPEWALLAPSRLWSNPVTASLVVRGLPEGAEVVLDQRVVGVAPLSSLVPAGAHALEVHVGDEVVATRELSCEAGELTTVTFDPSALKAPAPPTPIGTAAPTHVVPRAETAVRGAAPRHVVTSASGQAKAAQAGTPSASDMLAQARRLLRAERFELAAGVYQALRQTHPESAEARTVLVSLAELQLDRLGQPKLALANLEQYLNEGGGALVEEARRARIRALRVLGAEDRERVAIEEFLGAHPRSFAAAALGRRLAELTPQR